jgi:hypothetical protein
MAGRRGKPSTPWFVHLGDEAASANIAIGCGASTIGVINGRKRTDLAKLLEAACGISQNLDTPFYFADGRTFHA